MDPKEITRSPKFLKITRGRIIVSTVLSFVMVGSYFSYILVLAKRKDLLAVEMGNGLPIGIPIGVGLILLAWVLTGVYILWANSFHDSEVQKLKHALEK